MMHIDPNYRMNAEFNRGLTGDADAKSPTLHQYHLALWNKRLPNGEMLQLTSAYDTGYFFHCANTGGMVSSDGFNSYVRWKRLQHIITQLPEEEVDAFYDAVDPIGGYIIFPRWNGGMNQTRGRHSQVCDRVDLTLECIRRWYMDGNGCSPLYNVIDQDRDWYRLFGSFKGYVEFFHLQDLVTEDFSAVRFLTPDTSFDNPLFDTLEEYRVFSANMGRLVRARSERMAASVLVLKAKHNDFDNH